MLRKFISTRYWAHVAAGPSRAELRPPVPNQEGWGNILPCQCQPCPCGPTQPVGLGSPCCPKFRIQGG